MNSVKINIDVSIRKMDIKFLSLDKYFFNKKVSNYFIIYSFTLLHIIELKIFTFMYNNTLDIKNFYF